MRSLHPLFKIVAWATVACWFSGCSSKPTVAPKPGVVATVGDLEILTSELQNELGRRSSIGLEAVPEKVLDEMVRQALLVAHAKQLGLEQDPAVVRGYHNLLIARLKERASESFRPMASQDVNSLPIEANPLAGSQPSKINQIRLAILRQELPANASARKLELAITRMQAARAIAAKLPTSEIGFGMLAVDSSDDQASRYQGGDLGWMAEDLDKLHYDRTMLSAGFALKSPGELSPVIRGKDGLYVVKLLGRCTLQRAVSGPESDAMAARKTHKTRMGAIDKAVEDEARAAIEVAVHKERLLDLRNVAAAPSRPLPSL